MFMNILGLIYLFPLLVLATPPACLLSCIAEVSRTCSNGKIDFSCLCIDEDSVVGCLVDICPYGTFLSARDHYLGTCMEHSKPTNSNPNPPPPIYPPPSPSFSSISNSISSSLSFPTSITESVSLSTSLSETTTQNYPTTLIITTSESTVYSSTTIIRTRYSTGSSTVSITEPEKTQPIGSSVTTKYKPTFTSSTIAPTETYDVDDCDNKYDDDSDDNDYDNNDDEEEEDNEDEEDSDSYDCEWEETQTIDENGEIIIIRRPINVPEKHLDPKNNGVTRRVIIKKANGRKYVQPIGNVSYRNNKLKNSDNKRNRNSFLGVITRLKNPKSGTIPETKVNKFRTSYRKANSVAQPKYRNQQQLKYRSRRAKNNDNRY